MTALFKDVHQLLGQEEMTGAWAGSAEFTEVLFADDTICITNNKQDMTRLIHAIEKIGAEYGLHLNKQKCELLQFKADDTICFANGRPIPKQTEARYLGCWLNDHGDPARELRTRMNQTQAIWKKLQNFFLHGETSPKRKVEIYHAVVRSKLLYGLDSIALNSKLHEKLNIFQRRGLHQIFGITTTFVNRRHNNEYVLNYANSKIREESTFANPILPLTEIHKNMRIKMLYQIIRKPDTDPMKQVTF